MSGQKELGRYIAGQQYGVVQIPYYENTDISDTQDESIPK